METRLTSASVILRLTFSSGCLRLTRRKDTQPCGGIWQMTSSHYLYRRKVERGFSPYAISSVVFLRVMRSSTLLGCQADPLMSRIDGYSETYFDNSHIVSRVRIFERMNCIIIDTLDP
jgi:hypothetical protein